MLPKLKTKNNYFRPNHPQGENKPIINTLNFQTYNHPT